MTEEQPEEGKAINNVLFINKPDMSGVVALTTFDKGDDEKEFYQNYKEAVVKLITMEEFEILENEETVYLPHTAFFIKDTPPGLEQFVENDLDHYGDGGELDTVVIARSFERLPDGSYTGVHEEVEGMIQLPQIFRAKDHPSLGDDEDSE